MSYHGPLNLLGFLEMCFISSSDSMDKGPEEEEVNLTEGKIQGQRDMPNMDEKDEFINFSKLC